jgi:hypothetical protein
MVNVARWGIIYRGENKLNRSMRFQRMKWKIILCAGVAYYGKTCAGVAYYGKTCAGVACYGGQNVRIGELCRIILFD